MAAAANLTLPYKEPYSKVLKLQMLRNLWPWDANMAPSNMEISGYGVLQINYLRQVARFAQHTVIFQTPHRESTLLGL